MTWANIEAKSANIWEKLENIAEIQVYIAAIRVNHHMMVMVENISVMLGNISRPFENMTAKPVNNEVMMNSLAMTENMMVLQVYMWAMKENTMVKLVNSVDTKESVKDLRENKMVKLANTKENSVNNLKTLVNKHSLENTYLSHHCPYTKGLTNGRGMLENKPETMVNNRCLMVNNPSTVD